LEILKAKEIDLVICNAVLPDMNGLEVLKALKTIPHCEHLPVIFVSSQTQMDFKAKAFELGAQEFLIRPFDPDDLLCPSLQLSLERSNHSGGV
jgi:putative two-component system response regulator